MPKILIVEDNPENRDALARRLQRRGFEVSFADDGKAGLANAPMPRLLLLALESHNLGDAAGPPGCQTAAGIRLSR